MATVIADQLLLFSDPRVLLFLPTSFELAKNLKILVVVNDIDIGNYLRNIMFSSLKFWLIVKNFHKLKAEFFQCILTLISLLYRQHTERYEYIWLATTVSS